MMCFLFDSSIIDAPEKMNFFEGIILGLVQGITEFLPISSSGHLVILQSLFNIPSDESVLFEVVVHFATLLAICIYYRQKLKVFAMYSYTALKTCKKPAQIYSEENGRYIILIIIGILPAIIVGFILKDSIEKLFDNPIITGIALFVTSSFLISTYFKRRSNFDIMQITWIMALLIGIAQAVALIPGISRSGITISTALLLGINRRLSADFSFIIVIPAIIGATFISLMDIGEINSIGISGLVGGFLMAAVSGYLALIGLLKIIRNGKFYLFAPYCLALGAFSIIYFG